MTVIKKMVIGNSGNNNNNDDDSKKDKTQIFCRRTNFRRCIANLFKLRLHAGCLWFFCDFYSFWEKHCIAFKLNNFRSIIRMISPRIFSFQRTNFFIERILKEFCKKYEKRLVKYCHSILYNIKNIGNNRLVSFH